MTSVRTLSIGIISSIVFFTAGVAFADTTIHLHVEGPAGVIYDNAALSVAACPVIDTDASTTAITGKCALEQAGLAPEWFTSGTDLFLTKAGGVEQDFANNYFWNYWSDLSYGSDALNKHELHDGENLLIALGLAPLKVESTTLTPTSGATTTLTISQFFDASFNPVWVPADGATLHIGSATYTSDASGHVDIMATTSISAYATKTGFVQSDPITLNPQAAHATFRIRDGATLIGPYTIDIASAGSPDLALTATGTTTVHAIGAETALAALTSLDTTSSDFEVTDLQYFDSFASYIVNCISIPAASSSPECGNWLYAVNGSFPFVGMDQNTLHDGDSVTLFFNAPEWQVTTDKNSVQTNESFTATVLKYDPVTDTYAPAQNESIAAVQFDASFNPTVFATATTDANGTASLSLTGTGSYVVGVTSSGYFPNAAVTVTSSGGGGGGGGGTPAPAKSFDIAAALAYLSAKQNADGSFASSSSINDWTAIAFGSADTSSAKTKLRAYLVSASPTLSITRDYERHAMALEALGIDPYAGTPVNDIAPIVAAFDGTKIGTDVRDDIFGILPLLHAGYSSNDRIIQKAAAYTISQQAANGSWGDPDTTGAAIQALGPLFDLPGVNAALGKAAGYLASTEQADGGWSNIDSTSWVQTAINGIIEAHTPGFDTETPWTSSGGKLPTDALALAQQPDGAVRDISDSIDNRIWSTSYAVTAASGKSWVSILQSFPRPVTTTEGGGSISLTSNATSSITTTATSTKSVATSTIAVATSTPPIATSTPPIATSTPEVVPTQPTAATTTLPAPQTKPVVKKKITVVHTAPKPEIQVPAPVVKSSTQTASAATANPGVLKNMWNGFVSFLHHFF